jgi:anthranilate/para-aminobenzoate synthase component I
MQKSKSKVKPQTLPPQFIFHTLHEEWLADTETPVSLYLKLQSKYSCLLESVEGEERLARFSYIGLEPFAIFSATINGQGEFKLNILDKKFNALKSLVKSEVFAERGDGKIAICSFQITQSKQQSRRRAHLAMWVTTQFDSLRKFRFRKKKTLQNCLMCS